MAGRAARFRVGAVELLVRHEDRFALEETVRFQEYGFLAALGAGTDPPVVVDLGANIGLFSAHVLSMWPRAVVYSFEPSPETYKVLEGNRALNRGFAWNTYPWAVWSEDGQVDFWQGRHSTSGSILTGAKRGIGSVDRVRTISLQTLMCTCAEKRIDLMKMDIEGAEGEVLRTGASVLDAIEHLVVEVHPELCMPTDVERVLRRAYPYIFQVPGRRSSKPLLLASRSQWPLPRI